MIRLPREGRLTQGTIFCGAFAEGYRSLPTWGLVITARCDTTHDKTPLVNYVPMVRIDDWLNLHGGILVLDRVLAELRTRFRNAVVQQGLSATLLDVHAPAKIAEVHFPFPANPKESKKAERAQRDAEQSRELAREIQCVQEVLAQTEPSAGGIGALVQKYPKQIEAVVGELLGHKLVGYYYLPDAGTLTDNACDNGYVALLREIHHLPREAARMLASGISKQDSSQTTPPQICFDVFDFVYPVAEVLSPWIEHLMQAFCSMFGRIGIADIDKSRIRQIVATVTQEQQ